VVLDFIHIFQLNKYKRNLRVIYVITGEIKSKIDQIWNAFWSDGISNPLEVMEQITYLLFIRRL
jgi:type I restriction enzyme M protein